MKPIRTAVFWITAAVCTACAPMPGTSDILLDGDETDADRPVVPADSASQDSTSGGSVDEVVGRCCLGDQCFENLSQETCESNGGVFLGSQISCEYCSLGPDLLIYLKGIDSDHDGLSDLDELENGTDPYDPNDGPDVDGDNVDNPDDLDIDGDHIPNAYDDDIDGDGIVNKLDNDRDGDGVPNLQDKDDDGDGVEDAKDDDDDADGGDDAKAADKKGDDEGKADSGGKKDDDDDDEPPASQPEPENENYLLEMARRLFDDEVKDDDPEPADLVAEADNVLKAAENDPDEFDPAVLARNFFKNVLDGVAEEERARREEEALEFFRKVFDEDRDGVLDFVDEDPDGDGDADSDHDNVPDLQELRDGTDPSNPDTDKDQVPDGDEKELGTNPLSSDTDKDGLPDAQERTLGTDPTDADTDKDGKPDGSDASPNGG